MELRINHRYIIECIWKSDIIKTIFIVAISFFIVKYISICTINIGDFEWFNERGFETMNELIEIEIYLYLELEKLGLKDINK